MNASNFVKMKGLCAAVFLLFSIGLHAQTVSKHPKSLVQPFPTDSSQITAPASIVKIDFVVPRLNRPRVDLHPFPPGLLVHGLGCSYVETCPGGSVYDTYGGLYMSDGSAPTFYNLTKLR